MIACALLATASCGDGGGEGNRSGAGSPGAGADVPTGTGGSATVPVDPFDGDDQVSIPEPTTTSTEPPTTTTAPPTTTTIPPPILPGDALFDTDSDVLKAEATEGLERIAREIRRWAPGARVVIVGHTDSRGSAEHNLDLSRRRALAVRAWFINHGFDADRLVARGAGESQLLLPDVDAAGAFIESAGARNRRVEFAPDR